MNRNLKLQSIFWTAFGCVLSGCASSSIEYARAVKQGAKPWLTVNETASDPAFQLQAINVYKLVRKAKSPEGKKEGLKEDKTWAEGHGNRELSENSAIKTTVEVDGFESDNACLFKVQIAYASDKAVPLYATESSRIANCDQGQFGDPFLKADIPIEGNRWITLNYQVHP